MKLGLINKYLKNTNVRLLNPILLAVFKSRELIHMFLKNVIDRQNKYYMAAELKFCKS